ncbi:MAG: ATP-binding protein [Pseudomonadota bacterium]
MANIQVFLANADLVTLMMLAGLGGLFLGALVWAMRGWRRAEALAREHQAVTNRLAAVLNAANGAVIGLSRDGWIVLANLGARDWLGDTPVTLPMKWPTGVSFVDAETLETLPDEEDPIARAASGETILGELRAMAVAGQPGRRTVRLSSSPVLEDGTLGLAAVLFLEDVTREEHARLRRSQTDRLDILGSFAGGLAHEFNSLLAAVKYAIQMGEAAETPDKAGSYRGLALKSLGRGGMLSDRLLTFARRQPVIATSLPVDEVFASVDAFARPLIGDRVALTFAADEPGLRVFADRGRLEAAIVDLILNGRDAILLSGEGREISVRARPVSDLGQDPFCQADRGDTYMSAPARAERRLDASQADSCAFRYVEISVSDDGPGMEPATLQSAVEPLFTTEDKNTGKGLGLSAVYGFIQQANGVLHISSDLGQGTCVRLVLPRGQADGMREGRVECLPRRTGQGHTVLIVENKADQVQGMVAAVRSLGYAVTTADAVSDALECLKTDTAVDVLMTDLVLQGGLGGTRLADAARQIRPGLPVLFMSGYTGNPTADAQGMLAPVIQKPCLPGVLAQALDTALNPKTSVQDSPRERVKKTIS